MPIKEPDHPELIPAENMAPTADGKSAETEAKAVTETTDQVAWDTYLAIARIRTKHELATDLSTVKSANDLRRWGAEYFNSIKNLPAIATLCEILGSTPDAYRAAYENMFELYAKRIEKGEMDLKTAILWVKGSLFAPLITPGQPTPFEIHFNIEINDKTKAKLKKIATKADIKYEHIGERVSSHEQRTIDFLEYLYNECEDEADPDAWLNQTDLELLANIPDNRRALASEFRKLNIPLDKALIKELRYLNIDSLQNIRKLTPDESKIISFISRQGHFDTYSGKTMPTIIQIQSCPELKFEKFEKQFTKCSQATKGRMMDDILYWIFFTNRDREKLKRLFPAVIIANTSRYDEAKTKLIAALNAADEDAPTLFGDIYSGELAELCPAISEIKVISNQEESNILKLKEHFPKWYLKKNLEWTQTFIANITNEQWSTLSIRLQEIPELHQLTDEKSIEGLVKLPEKDWKTVKTLLDESLQILHGTKKSTENPEHFQVTDEDIIGDDQKTRDTEGIISKFDLIIFRLHLYQNPKAVKRDKPAFSLSSKKDIVELALKARKAFDYNPQFTAAIDNILLKETTRTRLRTVNYLCSLAELCKHDFKQFQKILEMYQHGIQAPSEYIDTFKIGSTDQDFNKFLYAAITRHTVRIPTELKWIFETFPSFNFIEYLTEENFLFALRYYKQNKDFKPETDEEKELKTKVDTMIDSNKDKILEFLENLRDQQLTSQKPDDLHKFKISSATLFSEDEMPNFRFINRTIAFIEKLSLHPTTISPSTVQSLLTKFSLKNKGDARISYSKTELVDFYEKTLSIPPALLAECLKCFDALIPSRENFSLMQNQVLKLTSIISTLCANLEGGKKVQEQLQTFFTTELANLQGQDQAKQKEILIKIISTLNESVKKIFEAGLGLKDLPEISAEATTELTPFLTYHSNIKNPDSEKKAILSLFILLKILGKWEDFKAGKELNIDQYFNGNTLHEAQKYLKKRTELDIFNAQLPEGHEDQWIGTLEEKSEAILIGDITSIADTLEEIERQNKHLLDADNFNAEEKTLLALVIEYGQQMVITSLIERFKNPKFENKITEAIPQNANEKTLIPAWQKTARILGSLLEFAEAIKNANIPPKTAELNKALTPSLKIIEIFKKIGEEMSHESGALAVIDDIEHLESILHKSRELLTEEEFNHAQEYIDTVKTQVLKLNQVKDELTQKFVALHEASQKTTELGKIFKSRLGEFKKIFLLEASERRVTLKSFMTGDLGDVIPHIRQCLGCTTKECNNDTNLTFGDRNRFSIITREAGMPTSTSLSDELVTVQKTVDEGADERGYSFVMDNVYGKSSRDILAANVLTVLKKLAKLKKVSAQPEIDIFVTQSALSSCSTNADYLEKRLREQFGDFKITPITKKVTIAQSSSGDGHYEIGGGFDGRVSKGEGTVSGLKISWSSPLPTTKSMI